MVMLTEAVVSLTQVRNVHTERLRNKVSKACLAMCSMQIQGGSKTQGNK